MTIGPSAFLPRRPLADRRSTSPLGVDRDRAHPRTVRAFVVLGIAVLALAALPATRMPATIAISISAALACLVGVWRYRPSRRGPWFAMAAMLGAWAAALSAAAQSRTELAAVLSLSGLLFGLAVVSFLFARERRRTENEAPHPTRPEGWGRHTDQLVVGTIVALGVVQAFAGALSRSDWTAAFAPIDVVLACLLLRFVASRRELPPSVALLLSGGFITTVYDCLVAGTGVRVTDPNHAVNVLWAGGMVLFFAGSLHPSMRFTFDAATLHSRRSEAARLIGLSPLALAPILLFSLGDASAGYRLPTWAYLVAGAVVAGLAITRGAQSVDQNEHQARHDPLTGLANRRGLHVAFLELLRTSQPADGSSVPVGRIAVLDLDDFKHINDTYGHEAGDFLLIEVSARLQAAAGPAGTVCRSGGDEFVLLLGTEAPPVGQILHQTFAAPFELDPRLVPHAFPVFSSAGWVEVATTSWLAHALADADVALYAAKGGDRGTAAQFEPHLREAVLGRLALGADLRRLLQVSLDPATGEPDRHRDAGELVLHYQPLVSLPDREVIGCEALLRWEHPTFGLLTPDEFLPVAESQGTAALLDTVVLEQACAAAAAWARLGCTWTISVNLGRSSMIDPTLADRVQRVLAETGLPADLLNLEITEHDQLPPDAGRAALQRLAHLGVGVSLDDFGTGYTSLAYLQRYPISVLKLDRSVTGVEHRGQGTALLAGVVGLADALGILVLAEGVESESQCDALVALGVDRAQGYLFDQPLAHDELLARYARFPLERRRPIDTVVAGTS